MDYSIFVTFAWSLMGAGFFGVVASIFLIEDKDSKVMLKLAGLPLVLVGFILAMVIS